jgi:hypothetical protein
MEAQGVVPTDPERSARFYSEALASTIRPGDSVASVRP